MMISFVIPFHNEEKNVPIMLEQLIKLINKHKWKAEIIPVNDKSSDRTESILNDYAEKFSYIKPLNRKKNHEEKGNTMGKALKEGTKKAIGDVVIWTMGDCSDDFKTYKQIIDKISDSFDMVFASRYMTGGSKGNLDTVKAFFSRQGTILARLLFKIPVHDITNAFRGFRKEVFNSSFPASDGFAISPEFAIRAHLEGFKLGEVPTIYHNRVEGMSNFKLLKMIRSYLIIYFILLYQYKLRRRYTYK